MNDELRLFASHWRLLGQSEHCLENYLSTLRRLNEHTPLTTAGPLDLRAWLAEQAQLVGDATLAAHTRAIRCFYRWRSEALDCEDPSRTLKLPKVAEPSTRSVSVEEYTKLLSSIPTTGFYNVRDRAIVATLWASGARLSEVAGIEVANLDLLQGVFVIPKSKSRRPRTVGLTAEAQKEIRRYLKNGQRRGPRLWLGTQSRPMGPEGVKQMLERRSKAAGLKITAHQFRRSLAERWLASGGSETLLRYHSGWESPLMVKRYIRHNGERLAVDEHRRLMG